MSTKSKLKILGSKKKNVYTLEQVLPYVFVEGCGISHMDILKDLFSHLSKKEIKKIKVKLEKDKFLKKDDIALHLFFKSLLLNKGKRVKSISYAELLMTVIGNKRSIVMEKDNISKKMVDNLNLFLDPKCKLKFIRSLVKVV